MVVEPDAVEIANELLTSFSEAGIEEGIKMHPFFGIRIRRDDEAVYW